MQPGLVCYDVYIIRSLFHSLCVALYNRFLIRVSSLVSSQPFPQHVIQTMEPDKTVNSFINSRVYNKAHHMTAVNSTNFSRQALFLRFVSVLMAYAHSMMQCW